MSQTDLVLMRVWSPMHVYCSQLAEFIIYMQNKCMFFWFSCPLSEFWFWFQLCTWWEFKTRMCHKCFMHRNDMEYTQLWGFLLPVMSHMQANHMDTHTHTHTYASTCLFFWGTKDVNSSTSKLMWQMSHSFDPDLDLRKFSLVVLATDYNLYFYHTHPHWDQELWVCFFGV